MYITEVKNARDALLFVTQSLRTITVKDVINALGVSIIFLILYAGLYLCIGDAFLPTGPAWAVMVVWLASNIGGFLSELIGVPAPVGMICAGLFLRNVHGAILIQGLKNSWSKEIRGAALAVIFLRSGIEIDLSIFKRIGVPAVKLLLIPGLVEAFFNGGLAVALFDVSALFGFALGFILKAIGPALVIQLMFELQQKRLGTAKNMPTVVVAAASFDDMVAITGYTIFINIAIQGSDNKAWRIAQGPLSVIFGILLGFVASFACSCTVLWNNKYKRIIMLIVSALSMKYFFDQYHFESGGALAALSLGLTVKELWRRKWPKYLASQDEEPAEIIQDAEKAIVFLWRFILMPLLFCLIGTSILFSTLPVSTIQDACALIVSGLSVRMVVTFLVMLTSGYSWVECIWFAIAWTPKATVQAALASLPGEAIARAYPVGTPGRERYVQWGVDAQVTAVFEILISGTLGCLMVRWITPKLLKQETEEAFLARQASARATITKAASLTHGRHGHKGPPSFRAGNGVAVIDTMTGDDALNHGNLVEDHVERLEELASVLIETGIRDGEDSARLYGQRLKSGVRALTSRLHHAVNPKDVIGAEAYRQAVEELNERRRAGPATSGLTFRGSRQLPPLPPLEGSSEEIGSFRTTGASGAGGVGGDVELGAAPDAAGPAAGPAAGSAARGA